MNPVARFVGTHLFYIILIAVGAIAFRSWLSEHDSRLEAEGVVKQQVAILADLKSQIVMTQQQAAQKVQSVAQVVKKASTPSQVVAAIPALTQVPLATREIPGNPVDVAVAAQPLMQLAGDDKISQIQLATCQQVGALKDQEIVAKDAEIAAFKKKKGFWHKLRTTLETVGVSVAAGLILAHV